MVLRAVLQRHGQTVSRIGPEVCTSGPIQLFYVSRLDCQAFSRNFSALFVKSGLKTAQTVRAPTGFGRLCAFWTAPAAPRAPTLCALCHASGWAHGRVAKCGLREKCRSGLRPSPVFSSVPFLGFPMRLPCALLVTRRALRDGTLFPAPPEMPRPLAACFPVCAVHCAPAPGRSALLRRPAGKPRRAAPCPP